MAGCSSPGHTGSERKICQRKRGLELGRWAGARVGQTLPSLGQWTVGPRGQKRTRSSRTSQAPQSIMYYFTPTTGQREMRLYTARQHTIIVATLRCLKFPTDGNERKQTSCLPCLCSPRVTVDFKEGKLIFTKV